MRARYECAEREEIGARVKSCAAEHRHTTALALRRAAGSARHDLQA
jgi:hypothetical protein